jgi:cytoskeletal protein CcmA (bactofilin family)
MKTFRRRLRDSAAGPRTFLAEGSNLKGQLSGAGAYVFCGDVDGDCDIEGLVTLVQGSHWQGTIRATDVVIAGVVEGDIIASGRVEIAGTAKIHGSLSGHSIAVAEGAVIDGELKVTSGGAPMHFHEKRNPPD